MATKRMINKKISVSEQIAEMPLEAQLIFTWSIPHSDDLGLLPHSMRTLKALIVPMQDWSIELFSKYWGFIVGQGLVQEFEYEGGKYWRIVKFFDFQQLRKDVQPVTILPVKMCAKAADSWSILYMIYEKEGIYINEARDDGVTSTERDVHGASTEDKGREDKGRKGNVKGAKKFVKPTLDQVAAYCKERKNTVDPQKFINYYESKGWLVGKSPMKDWKAAVRTWEGNGYSNKPVSAVKEGKYKDL